MPESHIESLYQQAQAVIKARDYEYACELLKRILAVDEDYKDTSRLLARAVRLRKRRWYNDPRLWGMFGAMAIFILGFVIAPRIEGSFASPASANTASPTVIKTAILTVLPTGTPPFAPTNTFIPEITTTSTVLSKEITDKKGVQMALVPAGEFTMGGEEVTGYLPRGGIAVENAHAPAHTVYLEAYYFDKYEVTNALYRECVSAGDCDPLVNTSSYTRPSYYDNPEFEDYPVIYVNQQMATTFCEWRSRFQWDGCWFSLCSKPLSIGIPL